MWFRWSDLWKLFWNLIWFDNIQNDLFCDICYVSPEGGGCGSDCGPVDFSRYNIPVGWVWDLSYHPGLSGVLPGQQHWCLPDPDGWGWQEAGGVQRWGQPWDHHRDALPGHMFEGDAQNVATCDPEWSNVLQGLDLQQHYHQEGNPDWYPHLHCPPQPGLLAGAGVL